MKTNILNEFLDYLQHTKSFSKGTIKGYELDLNIFFNFIIDYKDLSIQINQLSIFSITQIRSDDIVAFMIYLNYYKNNCSNTRQRKIAALKSFFKWFYMYYKDICKTKNPTLDLPSIQHLKSFPKFLTLKQAKELQNVFNEKNCIHYIRNNAILTLFLTTGIRLSELININIQDIDFDNNSIIIKGKGNKERNIYFNSYCKNKLLEYKKIRDKINSSSNAFFLSLQNKRICKGSIEYICKEAYKMIGVGDMGYTVHSLRHTAATIYFEYNNRDILLLKELLGHSSILSTEIYTHTYNDLVRDAVNKNPLSNFVVGKEK